MTVKKAKIRLIANFIIEMVEERKQCSNVFKILNENKYQHKSMWSSKASLKNEINNKNIFRKTKIRKIFTHSAALKNFLFQG